MKQWYALYTKPKAEYVVKAALNRRKIETCLPEITSSKSKKKKVPFLPCYIFARVDLEKLPLSNLIWTPGLRRIVSFDNRPAFVPDQVIELVRKKLQHVEGSGILPTHPFQPGDTVKIVNGPFEGLSAIFDGPTTPTERVQIFLTFLGQASRVHVNAADLKKGSPKAVASVTERRRRTRGRGRFIKNIPKPH